ncbi:aldo/keto reductase [Ascobolus immersus RN42]|uniref:Aldo/keto reductase n=1 Tax=Ascobolus immersus RN42 TaxID=1160509 RepID=A0A3N4IH62_ASCIM|nr:aldo/keto reductase [Ascobolus immersus RN42]
MSLPTAPLGRNGPEVVTVGFGLMGLHVFYGPEKSDEECFAILDRALEIGETFWDTSDLYGGNEAMLGRYFKARPGAREKVFLATKFGAYAPLPDGSTGTRSDPEWARICIDKSLKTLGVEFVDLYYVHRIDKNVPIEDTVEALVEFKNAGKIKHIGLSECSARTIERAHAIHPIAAAQVEYSPFSLDIEDNGVKATCEKLGIAVVAYSPLSRGILTGKIRSRSDLDKNDSRLTMMPRFSEENFDKNVQLVDELQAEADKRGITVGQLALAWLVGQGAFPIPGTTKIERLEENAGAAKVQLSKEDVEYLSKLIREAVPAGSRYAPGVGGPLYEDTVERK